MHLSEILTLIDEPARLTENDEAILEAFWRSMPKYRFFKNLPYGASVLDIGAGSGGLAFWREWTAPKRGDLKMFGIDFAKGEHARLYEKWWSGDLDTAKPDFGSEKFDAFLASHLIEHVASVPDLVKYLASAAAPKAQLYFEWPAPHTANLPKARELAERGFVMQTLNFFDDATHARTYTREQVGRFLEDGGFQVVEGAEIRAGLLAREMIARGRKNDDMSFRQMGLWAALGWCQYVIAEFQPTVSTR